MAKQYRSENYTFVLVCQTRHVGDDEDKNRTISISSKESSNPAQIIYWTKK
ncbi:MAG TPA: hypothetical protein VFM79_05370 [Pelobium sp.]|nr:hypothetical protein [Pelobium sp.]